MKVLKYLLAICSMLILAMATIVATIIVILFMPIAYVFESTIDKILDGPDV